MSKINQVKHRLRTDPNGILAWMDGGCLPQVAYESAEITGIQLSLMLDGHDDVYILSILPSDKYGQFDAWLRRMGSDDMVHMLSRRARDPEDVVVAALSELPEYIGLV